MLGKDFGFGVSVGHIFGKKLLSGENKNASIFRYEAFL
jgi:hypothetical protein